MKSSFKHLLANIICIVLLVAGSLFTIFFFGNYEMSRDFIVGTRYVTLFAVVGTVVTIGVEVASLIFDKSARKLTLYVSLMLLAFILTSRDSINMIAYFYVVKYPVIFDVAHSVVFFGVIFFMLRLCFQSYTVEAPIVSRLGISFLAVVAIADNILVAFGKQFISALLIIQFVLVIYFVMFFYSNKKRKVDLAFVLTSFNFFAITGAYVASGLGIMNERSTLGLESWFLIVMLVFIFIIYGDHLVKALKKSYDAQEYEEKVKELQTTVFMEQINPHFIFNSLTLIKSIYIEDRKKGDKAIDMLAKHIRANVDVKGGKLLIPIEEELKNIECFVGLANMQNKKPINVIYNIDAYDFIVPTLSIEPFIENAIKYSRIQEKENGYIEVATLEDANNYIIKVIDNGVGFNEGEREKNSSQGIKNALNRFEFLLKAKTKVTSEVEEGTTIQIVIPKDKEEK